MRIEPPGTHARRWYRGSDWVWGALALAGCPRPCEGPDCEAEFDQARLAVHGLSARTEPRQVWADADGQLIGATDHGSSWAAASSAGRVAVGLPDVDEVWITKPPAGAVALGALSRLAGPEGARFGERVAWSEGGGLLVSAPDEALDRGAVYLFRSIVDGQDRDAEGAEQVVTGVNPGDALGASSSGCGDATGDGVADALVGAPRASRPLVGPFSTGDLSFDDLAGTVHLLDGAADRSSLLATESERTWWGDRAAALGTALWCGSDVDGDGLADVLAGAPYFGDDDRGAVYLVRGRPLGELPQSGPVSEVADEVWEGTEPDGWFGYAVAAGDADADGRVEIAVGAPGADAGRGAALLLRADGDAYVVRASIEPPGDRDPGDHVGRSVWMADLDGGGGADLVVGAPDWVENGAFDAGRVAVFFGEREWSGVLRMSDDPHVVVTGALPYQRVGTAMGAADLDGDGSAELMLPTRAAGE